MAAVKNVTEKVNSMRGNKPVRYDLTVMQMQELKENFGHDFFDLISASFNFGFYQGQKAERNRR